MNKQAVFIDKQTEISPLSFQAFVNEGINTVQQLSGHVWTDYNTHDPGVTLLEQLCFALSDHVYKNNFAVEDYLLGNATSIDLEAVSLHVADDIFAIHPSTNEDLCEHFLHVFPELESIHIVHASTASVSPTLVDVYVAVNTFDNDTAQIVPRLVYNIEREFFARRSLNQMVNKVACKSPVNISIAADIKLESAANSAIVLATIYVEIQKIMQVFQTQGTSQSGLADELMTQHIAISELFGTISKVHQVSAISNMAFIDQTGIKTESIQFDRLTQNLRLYIPSSPNEVTIQLYLGSRILTVDFGQFSSELNKQTTLHKQAKQGLRNRPKQAKTMTTAINQDLSHYMGISAFFPTNYKLKKGELLSTDSKTEHAANSQFKAYLAIFDQLLCDQTQTLAHISTLFSPTSCVSSNDHVDVSQFVFSGMPITSEHMYGLSTFTDASYPTHLTVTQESHNKFLRRANKVADYFLALYGEKLNQRSLSGMYAWDTPVGLEEHKLANKITMLKHIKYLTKNRLKAANFVASEKGVEDLSGLELKLSLLLGFDVCKHTQLQSLKLHENGMHIIEHGVLGKVLSESDLVDIDVPIDFFSHQITIVFPNWTRLTRQAEFRELAQESMMLNTPAHIYPHLLFLDVQQMHSLERLLQPWQQHITQQDQVQACKAASLAIAKYLYKRLAKTSIHYHCVDAL